MGISELIDSSNIQLDLDSGDIKDCVHSLTEMLVKNGRIPDLVARALEGAMESREKLGATTVGRGVIIPHAYLDGIPELMICIARLNTPLSTATPDNIPVDLVFLLTGPQSGEDKHLQLLARIVRLLHDENLLVALRRAESVERVIEAIQEVENRHA